MPSPFVPFNTQPGGQYYLDPNLPPNEFNQQLGNAMFQVISSLFTNPLNQINRIGGQAENIPVYDPNLGYADVFRNAGYDNTPAEVMGMIAGMVEPGPGEISDAAKIIGGGASLGLPLVLRQALGQGTKLVDETGALQQVYHSTNSGMFDRFDPSRTGTGTAGAQHGNVIFFAEDPQVALNATANSDGTKFGTNIRPQYLSTTKPFMQGEALPQDVITALDSLMLDRTLEDSISPSDYSRMLKQLEKIQDGSTTYLKDYEGKWGEDGAYQLLTREFFGGNPNKTNEFLQSLGYDSMHHLSTEANGVPNKNVWMMFNPDNVYNFDDVELGLAKSITTGKLDPTSPEFQSLMSLVDSRTASRSLDEVRRFEAMKDPLYPLGKELGSLYGNGNTQSVKGVMANELFDASKMSPQALTDTMDMFVNDLAKVMPVEDAYLFLNDAIKLQNNKMNYASAWTGKTKTDVSKWDVSDFNYYTKELDLNKPIIQKILSDPETPIIFKGESYPAKDMYKIIEDSAQYSWSDTKDAIEDMGYWMGLTEVETWRLKDFFNAYGPNFKGK